MRKKLCAKCLKPFTIYGHLHKIYCSRRCQNYVAKMASRARLHKRQKFSITAFVVELHDQGGFNFEEISEWLEIDVVKARGLYYNRHNKEARP